MAAVGGGRAAAYLLLVCERCELIRMQLESHASVGLLDFLVGGVPPHIEHLVVAHAAGGLAQREQCARNQEQPPCPIC